MIRRIRASGADYVASGTKLRKPTFLMIDDRPQYRFRTSGNSSCNRHDDRPFRYCTNFAGAMSADADTSM
jgi:hypothetical protein